MPSMAREIPLSTLLSQILVAFTIEFDNEAEHRMPHRTTDHGRSALSSLPAPWLTSMVMWFNCMQHLGDQPIPLSELERRARTATNFDGMQRWGYITVTNPSAKTPLSEKKKQPRRSGSTITPTAAGRAAQNIWRPLFAVIERRWCKRFGGIEFAALRHASCTIARQLDPRLPDCLPILGYGLRNQGPDPRLPVPAAEDVLALHLPSLLSKILLAFALEFENESRLSLAICANVLRVLTLDGVMVRDLPIFSGVSKESIHMAFSILTKMGLATVTSDSKKKIARLSEVGYQVLQHVPVLLATIEERWQSRFGQPAMSALQEAAEFFVEASDGRSSLLFQAIEPYPDGWRAARRRPNTLPHFPMILHRGGYPDGS